MTSHTCFNCLEFPSGRDETSLDLQVDHVDVDSTTPSEQMAKAIGKKLIERKNNTNSHWMRQTRMSTTAIQKGESSRQVHRQKKGGQLLPPQESRRVVRDAR